MDVLLSPEFEQLVAKKVSSGLYPTSSDVVEEGLRLLKARDEARDALKSDIEAGFEDIDAGDFTDYSLGDLNELADNVKARGRNRMNALTSIQKGR